MESDMLQMRPGCECCNVDLPPDSNDAWICSFECTFCTTCVESKLRGRCPNCGGSFSKRPTRVGSALERHPASTERIFKSSGCAPAA
ncbi:DUF1272 domain-containing protein [Metallibacterium scheffleri]